ncbi:methylamine utilization protein MauE [Sphingomonas oleivorans]|uniref:Methylamine utilization protein MauE n=1 Tax=Sphingomonas oleivorans TaxID=1735121 RepID=A0A2T5FYY5_9SPHN|nr:MauE/DoxX family redox-associated membrane protein [Sphingomonas oleivorans]PTQ11820.1 methylamine utilization protein MauE [Sphingomonas oleivorans]
MIGIALAQLGMAGQVFVGLVFLVASWSKLRDMAGFEGNVSAYGLLPARLVPMAARMLAFVELLIGLLLLSGMEAAWHQAAAMALLLAFAMAMAINIGRGRRMIGCGCQLSTASVPLGWHLVARNVALSLLLACSFAGPAPNHWLIVSNAIMAGILLFLLYVLHEVMLGWRRSRLYAQPSGSGDD